MAKELDDSLFEDKPYDYMQDDALFEDVEFDAEATAAPEDPGMLPTAIRSAGDVASFGLMDELVAAFSTGLRGLGVTGLEKNKWSELGLTTPGIADPEWSAADEYSKVLDRYREVSKKGYEENPITSGVAGIAGALGPGAAGASLLKGAGKGAQYLGGIGLGTAGGATYGFGAGEGSVEDRIEGAKSGAVTGAVAGAALPPLIGAVGAAGGALLKTETAKRLGETFKRSSIGQKFTGQIDEITKEIDDAVGNIYKKFKGRVNKEGKARQGLVDIAEEQGKVVKAKGSLDKIRKQVEAIDDEFDEVIKADKARMLKMLDEYEQGVNFEIEAANEKLMNQYLKDLQKLADKRQRDLQTNKFGREPRDIAKDKLSGKAAMLERREGALFGKPSLEATEEGTKVLERIEDITPEIAKERLRSIPALAETDEAVLDAIIEGGSEFNQIPGLKDQIEAALTPRKLMAPDPFKRVSPIKMVTLPDGRQMATYKVGSKVVKGPIMPKLEEYTPQARTEMRPKEALGFIKKLEDMMGQTTKDQAALEPLKSRVGQRVAREAKDLLRDDVEQAVRGFKEKTKTMSNLMQQYRELSGKQLYGLGKSPQTQSEYTQQIKKVINTAQSDPEKKLMVQKIINEGYQESGRFIPPLRDIDPQLADEVGQLIEDLSTRKDIIDEIRKTGGGIYERSINFLNTIGLTGAELAGKGIHAAKGALKGPYEVGKALNEATPEALKSMAMTIIRTSGTEAVGRKVANELVRASSVPKAKRHAIFHALLQDPENREFFREKGYVGE